MTYYIYHIPGKKIGVTRDLKYRVEEQQGYSQDEYDIIMKSDNIEYVSEQEIYLQKRFGYKIDETPYNELKFNNDMNINVTEQTTTFPCPVNKLKGQLMDNVGMRWETDHGEFTINTQSIEWVMRNVQTSKYNTERCYVYNKAFARFYDNHQIHDQYNGKTKSGALSPTGVRQMSFDCHNCDCNNVSHFDLIRQWADQRGLYEKGDAKTQYVKLMEEAGEVGRAILKDRTIDVIDGIGDMVVVLTNLAELVGVPIEECIEIAYNVIAKRKGKMVNGTFVKDE